MIIRHSSQLLENLAEIESRIQAVEELIDDLGLEIDKEKILLMVLNRKRDEALLRKKKND